MTPIERAAINRENAKHSTGPKTPEGKRRVSLNALKHGLTGQTVVLPGEDPHTFIDFCADYHAELKPSGKVETQLVFTIAQTQWRINRAGAWEDDIVSLGVDQHSDSINTEDPAIHCALAQGKTVLDQMDKIAKLGLYQQRLTRTLHQSLAKLEQMQTRRKAEEEEALKQAAKIQRLKDALEEDWEPAESGFEFSSERLDTWMAIQEVREEADKFFYGDELPDSDDDDEPNDDESPEPAAA
jgi:hypothetical protein